MSTLPSLPTKAATPRPSIRTTLILAKCRVTVYVNWVTAGTAAHTSGCWSNPAPSGRPTWRCWPWHSTPRCTPPHSTWLPSNPHQLPSSSTPSVHNAAMNTTVHGPNGPARAFLSALHQSGQYWQLLDPQGSPCIVHDGCPSASPLAGEQGPHPHLAPAPSPIPVSLVRGGSLTSKFQAPLTFAGLLRFLVRKLTIDIFCPFSDLGFFIFSLLVYRNSRDIKC